MSSSSFHKNLSPNLPHTLKSVCSVIHLGALQIKLSFYCVNKNHMLELESHKLPYARKTLIELSKCSQVTQKTYTPCNIISLNTPSSLSDCSFLVYTLRNLVLSPQYDTIKYFRFTYFSELYIVCSHLDNIIGLFHSLCFPVIKSFYSVNHLISLTNLVDRTPNTLLQHQSDCITYQR